MGVAGAGSLQQVVNAAIANKGRMARFREFFAGVGSDDRAGIWEGDPNLRPEFRSIQQKKLERQAKAAKAQEMV